MYNFGLLDNKIIALIVYRVVFCLKRKLEVGGIYINFIFDLDGTVLRDNSDTIDPELKNILYQLSTEHKLYFATGRDKLGVMNFLDCNPDWYNFFKKKFVYLDGGVTVIGREEISESSMIISQVPKGFDFVLFYSECVVFSNKTAFYKYKLLFPNIDLTKFSEYYSISPAEFKTQGILKIFLFPKNKEDYNVLKEYILKYKDYTVKFYKPFRMIVIKGGGDKYYGVRKIIGADDYFAFGDGLNDGLLFLNSVYSVNLGRENGLDEMSNKTIMVFEDFKMELKKWIK